MKKYTIGLITGALLAVSAMMFIGAQNKNLGDITADSIVAKSIILIGELGQTVIIGGGLSTNNAKDKMTSALGTDKSGVGYYRTFNADGKETAFLGTSKGGKGFLSTFNAEGKKTVFLGTGDGGDGILSTYNKYEVRTGYFGTNKDNDGMAALLDRYGDVGWSASGKR